MNFTPELLMFQGAILSADNMRSFAEITGRGGNEDVINTLVTNMRNFLKDVNYINKDGVTREGKRQLKIACFYLVLNADIPVLEKLSDIPDIENLFFTIPVINKHIICDLVKGLYMEPFLKEILIFCHPELVVQILKQFTYHIRYSAPTECVGHLKLLLSACYKFICRLHFYNYDNAYLNILIIKEIYNSFLTCINYYVEPPNAEQLNRLTEDEQDVYKGYYLYNLFTLIMECLEQYLNPPNFESEGYDDMYLYTIDSNNIKTKSITHKICESDNRILLDCLEKFNEVMLDKCQVLVMGVSVQVYCVWSEHQFLGRSMQQTIRETCYKFLTMLNQITPPLEHPIMSMLPQMSCKPADLHDVIHSADIATIIENALKESNEKIHWVQAIIDVPDLSKNKQLLELLISNTGIIEVKNNLKLFKMMVQLIKNNVTEHLELYQALAFNAFTQLGDETKTQLTLEHFPGKLFQNTLETVEFNNINIELFNKFIESPTSNPYDVLNTFIQNPFEVFKTIVNSAINNSKQCDFMLNAMNILKPFVNHYYNVDTDPTLIKIILGVLQHKQLTDMQINNFVTFVSKLKINNILCEAKLLLLIIMPTLHEALVEKHLKMINLNVQLLKHGYEENEFIKYRAPLLAMMGQVLEVVRWTPSTFHPDAPTTLEAAIQLQINIFNTYQSQIPAKEANWLRSKLKNLQPLNMYYYKELWNPPGTDFLGVIAGQDDLLQISVLLARTLPSLSLSEWLGTWQCVVRRAGGKKGALREFHRAGTLTRTLPPPCLLHCLSNHLTVIKDNFLYEPITNEDVQIAVDRIISIINDHGGDHAEEVTRIVLPLISYLVDRKNDYTLDISCMTNKIQHQYIANMISQLFVKK